MKEREAEALAEELQQYIGKLVALQDEDDIQQDYRDVVVVAESFKAESLYYDHERWIVRVYGQGIDFYFGEDGYTIDIYGIGRFPQWRL